MINMETWRKLKSKITTDREYFQMHKDDGGDSYFLGSYNAVDDIYKFMLHLERKGANSES